MNTAIHVFEGKPDDWQADTKIVVSRFRPKYRALDPEEKQLHDEIKEQAVKLEELFAKVPAGRYASLAFTSLEESVMWIIKQLTA